MCAGKTAQVESTGNDRYGRVLGWVTCGTQNANAEQVRRGMAWVFDHYTKANSPLHSLPDEARATRRGFCVDKNPMPPWEWRRKSHGA